jgi:site-specific DNA-methyltransferase (adenine-specific)
MSEVTLHLGDCLEVMKSIPDGSVDAVVTDPPYGTTDCKWDTVIPFEPMWEQLKRIAKPRAAIVLFSSQPFTSALVMSNVEMFKYEWVWEKDKGANFGVIKYRPFAVSEYILVFSTRTPSYYPQMWDAGFVSNRSASIGQAVGEDNVYGPNGLSHTWRNATDRYPRNIIQYDVIKHNDGHNGGHFHPTQKPVALLEYLIRTYTNEGDTVLDFTMGSGTTMVACVNTQRNGIGIEILPEYFDIATRRIHEAQMQPNLFEVNK